MAKKYIVTSVNNVAPVGGNVTLPVRDISTINITLAKTGWSSNIQTITDDFFIATGYSYIIAPTPSSFTNWGDAVIYADDVTEDTKITFHCESVPSVDIVANIMRVQM